MLVVYHIKICKTSGDLSEEPQNTNSKEYMHPTVHSSVIYNSHDMEASQEPINRCIDKKAVVHLHNKILLSYKKECNSMNGRRRYYV